MYLLLSDRESSSYSRACTNAPSRRLTWNEAMMTIPTARPRHLAGMALLVAVTLGCQSRTPQSESSPASMLLSVQNSSEFQVNVFAVPSAPSSRVRLGSVAPLSNGQLSLPQNALGAGGALKVMVDPVGSTSEWISSTVTVSAETRPCLRVQTDAMGDLARSTLTTHVGDGTACP